jgi:hypothetical protein
MSHKSMDLHGLLLRYLRNEVYCCLPLAVGYGMGDNSEIHVTSDDGCDKIDISLFAPIPQWPYH